MDGITQLLAGSSELILSAGFIANLFVLVVCLESISVAIGSFASMGR